MDVTDRKSVVHGTKSSKGVMGASMLAQEKVGLASSFVEPSRIAYHGQ